MVALIDPAIERATSVLQKKCETFVRSAYENTRVFKTLEDFVKNMTRKDMPRAVVVGSPPMFRGTTQPGRDIELQVLKNFPGVALFVEKPVSSGPEDACWRVAGVLAKNATLVGVGYMLRYLRGIRSLVN